MAYQEVTRTSYGSRVKSSFAGIGTGILLFFAGTALLWWNEGRAVKTTKMLNEAQGVTVEMPDVKKVNPEFEGQLVHATGLATTTDSLVDTQYGVGAVAIQLAHTVEYYQWVENVKEEKKDKLGGAQETVRTYTYEQRWTSSPVNSGSFKDPAYQGKNFTLHQAENDTKYAENVTFGAYKLNESQIHSISKREPLSLDFDDAKLKQWDTETGRISVAHGGPALNAPATVAATTAPTTAANDSVQQPTVVKDLNYVHIADNVLYFGVSPSSPQVGDVRVTFTKVMPTTVSLLATVTGDTFKPFKAKNGKTLQVLTVGSKSSDEMYESEHQTNTMILWLLRFVGVMMVIGGLKGIFGFIETLLKVVPFVANIVGFGVNTICTVVGIVWSLIVIAVAWLFYRPLLGILLLALAGFLIWVFAFKGKEKLKGLANRNGAPQGPQPAQAQAYQQPYPQQPYQAPQQPQQYQQPQQQYQQPQQQYQAPQQPQQYQQPQQPYQAPQQPQQYQQPQQPYQAPQQPQQYQQPQQPYQAPQQPQQYQQPYPQQPQQYNEDFEDVN